MKKIKKIIWKLYNKISKYDESIKAEYEYELWKELECTYYKLYKKMREKKEEIQDTDDVWEEGITLGKLVAYQTVWNNIYDRFFYACKATGRMKEFNELKKERL